MRTKAFKYFVGDFETTVFENQEFTEVWASAFVELFSEDVKIFHSIDEQFEYMVSLKENICCYYHNLKFDGGFWLSFLLDKMEYQQAYKKEGEKITWLHDSEMKNKMVRYSISDRGQWYSITIKINNIFIELRDSLKLLPFSVRKIGESFGTKHKKLDMDYKGFRFAGCEITDEEKNYIKNDVLVVKEALEIMFKNGHNKLTIGSCCLTEYKKIIGNYTYSELFPDLFEIRISKEHKYSTAGDWIHKSYKGGWCYLVPEKANLIKKSGITADVNSLYPSMMSSESRNLYPYGKPFFWTGNYIPEKALEKDKYFFVRIKTRFYIKHNYLPFVQIKGNPLYKGTECLKTSDIYDKKENRFYTEYVDEYGKVNSTRVELTLTMTDYFLLKEHYELVDFEILDGCYFYGKSGLFDEYINKYKKIKLENKGAIKELAKLFLNNLYGKMASSKDSSFKVAYLKEDRSVNFFSVSESNKKPGYIAVGSAITSYARNFTIRAAQKNYYGVNRRGFIYADTDSIHCDLKPSEIKGITVHSKNFCCWKLESSWDVGFFSRQKTYIEHITHENLEKIETPYFNVKCAGMPEKCKNLFIRSMSDIPISDEEKEKYNTEEISFIEDKKQISNFKIGLKVPGKLRPIRIKGGVLLIDTPYEMR